MKFYIKKMTLWYRDNSEPRTLSFKPNKVNVITGRSGTGKTSLLSIFDYCMLATNANIPESVINESVSWYGLEFRINDKDLLIIRKSPENNKASDEVFFSSDASYPEKIQKNIDIKQVKSVIEKEFGIDENFKILYGGNHLRNGSKISYRYFLLFNTLSEDTIAHGRIYYDFHLYDEDKYKEALERIFYLAIGVDDFGNVLSREKIENLKKEISKIGKRKKAVDREEKLFSKEIINLISRAQQYDLIERKLFTFEDGHQRLKQLISQFRMADYSNNIQRVDELNKQKRVIYRQIRNLERFNNEYEEYKKNLTEDYDSLKPIEYLDENFGQLIQTVEVRTFLHSLKESLQIVKREIGKKKPISVNVKNEVATLKNKLVVIEEELGQLSTDTKDFSDEVHKLMFIGELKSQLEFYEKKWDLDEVSGDISHLEDQIEALQIGIKDTEEKKRLILADMEKLIQSNFNEVGDAMGSYKDFSVFYDVSEKMPKLRRPKTFHIESTVGSKSNYMFLHLVLFLGFHEHFMNLEHSYVPQLLFLDQPSQPYYEDNSSGEKINEITDDDDKSKLLMAFKLLNGFVSKATEVYNTDFQFIMLEHAPKSYWEDNQLDNFHLVEEFRNGNALINKKALPAEGKQEDVGDDIDRGESEAGNGGNPPDDL